MGRGSAQGGEGVGTPRRQTVLRERGEGEWAAGGEGGGPPATVFFALVGGSPCSFLAARAWGVHAAQRRAGRARVEGAGKARRKSSRPPRSREQEAGREGAGVAPGVRHNPVFGSPGEEFPPLHPCPAPLPNPPQTARGAPPGVPETRGLCYPAQCCRGSRKKVRRGGTEACPGQGGGEEEDPSPRELAPTKAWKEGSAWGLRLPCGVWLEPQPNPWPWSARQLAK